MDDDVVADFHVVAEGELDVLERFEVLAAALEDVRREQPPKLHPQPDVLAADGMRSNEYQSQSSGLTGWKLASSQSRVVLGLERDVARISTESARRVPVGIDSSATAVSQWPAYSG